jgi:ribosome-associated translation inhibitor RaiA
MTSPRQTLDDEAASAAAQNDPTDAFRTDKDIQPADLPGEGQASLALLRLSGEFTEADRARIVERLSKLDRRLQRFPADGTDLHLTVKDREQPGQKVTLEARLPKFGHFAATSTEADLRAALMDVREDLWRQIDDAVNRRKGI